MPEVGDEVRRERLRRDAHEFVFGVCRTKDEHGVGSKVETVKQFPDDPDLRATLDLYLVSARLLEPNACRFALEAGIEIPYLEELYRTCILFIEKSRHVMATWLSCAYLLWRARRNPHQLIMVQSKREEDAAALVYDKEPSQARISFLEWSLPENLRLAKFPQDGKYCHLTVGKSHIWAIPEGGHIIRSHNPSVLFSDEAAFQPEFGEAYTAALPAVTHGGQLIVVSSAEPSEFQQIVEAEN